MSNWTSVKDALPERGKPVLVYGRRGGIYTAIYGGDPRWPDDWYKLNAKHHDCNPTHWMPLPDPPEAI